MKYTHIVFDIDGTITDTENAALEGMITTLEKHGREKKTKEALRFVMGIPGVDALAQLGFLPEEIPAALADWEDGLRAHNDEIGIFDGVQALVDAFERAGCALGIATSKTRDQYVKDFERFEIAKQFAVSVTADDSLEHKPTGGPLRKYMELTGAKREEILYIGDAIYDQLCAKDAGVDFVLATWGAQNPALEAAYSPAHPMQLLEMIG